MQPYPYFIALFLFLFLVPGFAEAQTDEDYIPEENSEIMTIKYRIHVIQKSADDPQNFRDGDSSPGSSDCTVGEHTQYLTNVLNYAADHFREVALPRHNGVENPDDLPTIGDTRIRLEQIGCINYIVDEVGYNEFYGSHNYINHADFTDALNIFFVNFPEMYDSRGGVQKSYNDRPYILMNSYSILDNPTRSCPWVAGTTLIHEIGHAFGLAHSFLPAGSFSDTYPATPNQFCDVQDTPPFAQDPYDCTNNFMTYSNVQNHVSPLQAGRMRKTLALDHPYFLEQPLDVNNPYEVTTDTEWNTDQYFNRDIIVRSSNTLTVKKCLSMGEFAAIYVEKNATLVVDGGTISAKRSPDIHTPSEQDLWRGIFAAGNGFTEQSPQTHASIILNGATLSYARTAIICAADNQTHSGGGAIINANYSTFYNNKRDIAFMYFNRENHSEISNCKFIADWRYSNKDGEPDQSITSFHNWGQRINRCEFTDSRDRWNMRDGIFSLRSSFYISNSNFTGYSRAIRANQSIPGERFTVFNSDFDRNTVGIEASNEVPLRVTSCSFAIGAERRWEPDLPFGDANHGIIVRECPELSIGNSQFSLSAYEDPADNIPPAGILIQDCADGTNLIGRNDFNHLTNGVISFGQNYQSADQNIGLYLRCNRFEACTNSIFITGDGPQNNGMAKEQAPGGISANNQFISLNGNPAQNTLRNEGSFELTYNFYEDEANLLPSVVGSVDFQLVDFYPCVLPRGEEKPRGKRVDNTPQTTKIYPNPVGSGSFRILLAEDAGTIGKIRLLNTSGLEMSNVTFRKEGHVDLNGLVSGMYLVVLEFKDGRQETHRIIVK